VAGAYAGILLFYITAYEDGKVMNPFLVFPGWKFEKNTDGYYYNFG